MSSFTNAVNAEDQGVQYISTTGAWSGLDGGAAGQVLTSNGANMAPSFQPAAGGGITTINGNTSSTGASTTPTISRAADFGNFVFDGNGSNTLSFKTGDATNRNTFAGPFGGNTTLSGTDNTAFGWNTGPALTSGAGNTSYGAGALPQCASGSNNTAVGFQSLNSLGNGSTNTCLGFNAGVSYTGTESSNICIRNSGTAGESNVLRIGTTGSGAGQQNAAYIAGIASVAVSNKNYVTIDTSTGQLGSDSGPSGLSVAFQANLSTNQTGVTGDSTLYQIVCDNVTLNTGSGYNGGTGVFTAPSTGVYLFTMNIFTDGYAGDNTQFYIDNSGGGTLQAVNMTCQPILYTNALSWSATRAIYLTASSTVGFYFAVAGHATKNVNVKTNGGSGVDTQFCGFKIG